MNKVLERLATLNRPEKRLIIKSADGEQEVPVFYRCPTMAEDRVLQKAMQEEYDATMSGLVKAEDGETSVHDRLAQNYTRAGKDVCANYLVSADLWDIRREVIEANDLDLLDELPKNATTKQKNEYKEKETAFLEVFKPAFDKRVDEKKEIWTRQYTVEDLAERCATAECEKRAQQRALEVHRRNLVAYSIYDKEDNALIRVFDSADQVAEFCTEQTVQEIAVLVSKELQEQRNLPFNSAGKK